jgi:hypothetical protein
LSQFSKNADAKVILIFEFTKYSIIFTKTFAMNGINFVTNESGAKTAIMIDFNSLRQHSSSGHEVVQYLSLLEDIEDIIDVELSRTEPSEDWDDVKRRLKTNIS